ncbi:V-type proton ATPase 16 kDa proteolipid subunit-like, partial [Trifolium medium]|nr:V-type proton ATPase 16 kDa proteolipid subunit-like [Trifolium medium]
MAPFSGDETAPFFGFLGAAAALVFSCIYGLIIAVIISTGINPKAKSYYLFDGYAHLSSGLACGLAGLSA